MNSKMSTDMTTHALRSASYLILLCCATPAYAADSCTLPASIEQPRLEKVDCRNNIKPESWVLALSWSPYFCAGAGKNPDQQFQCRQNKFGFVVHGLWGQNDEASGMCDQPRHCGSSLVGTKTVRDTLCTVPGVKLIQGEWQKHGSCSGMNESDYFAKTRSLSAALVKPDLSQYVDVNKQMSAGDIATAFVKANPGSGLFKEAIAIHSRNNKLQEVLVCYDLTFKFSACKVGKTPDKVVLKVTPRQ